MTYRFGPFRYDAEQRLLFQGEQLVSLEPKALETLHVLLEHQGRVVEKTRLMELVWPDAHVEEVGLARNVSLLRKTLGDESDGSSYIETVPRRGYRFAAEVTRDAPADPPAGSPAGTGLVGKAPPVPRSWTGQWRWALAGLAALLVVALIYDQFYVPSQYLKRGEAFAGLAVIPFECICPGMDADQYARGFNAVMVAEIAKLNGVEVLSPSTVRRHQSVGISTGLMGRLLGLEMLVEGTIQEMEDQLRVTTRLVDVHTGRVIWAQTYDQPSGAPDAAQLAVSLLVASEIRQRLDSQIP